jgi:signal transduction histidine kinase
MSETDGRAQDALARIERSAGRCDQIIDELLDFTRIHGAQPRLLDLDPWLGKVLAEQPVQADIQIETRLGLGHRHVEVDPERLRRAVINLYDNACQAMAERQVSGHRGYRARLTVTTRRTPERVELEFADNGSGIEDEVLPRIFEPLYSTKGFGVGLGLPIVKQIMEQMRGGVDVDSARGRGTRFVLWLPVT